MKKIYIGLSLIILCFSFTHAQTISTYAGNGTAGHMGDGNLATTAELYNPYYMSCDKNGNVYFVDATNCWLRKVDAISGIITTIAGIGSGGYNGDNIQATAASLSNPLGTAEDANGNVFISDQGNNRIRMIDATTGIITTVAGNGIGSYSGDGGQATSAEMYYPSGLSIDAVGNLYISDAVNACIRKVTKSTGIITTIAGIGGVAGFSGDGGPATDAELQQPFGNLVDANGNVYVADGENNVVRFINTGTGVITTFAGNYSYGAGYSGDGGPATAAELSFCYNIAFDPGGNVYICDPNNWVIREVDLFTGSITTVAGNHAFGQGWSGDGGPATGAELNYPLGLASDNRGNLFIGDVGENRVREVVGIPTSISPSPVLTSQSTVYPNPANKELNVTFSQPYSDAAVLRVFDLSGKEVLTDNLSPFTYHYSLDISSLAAGMYFIHIENKSGVLLSSKFAKE